MLDAYARIGMPIGYHHWSFGKHFIINEQQYKRGQMGLAYEMVINSNPCIAYLMEENSMMMQCLVMAHACFGHNSFFKSQLPVPAPGPTPRPSSTTWCSPVTTSPSANSATASSRSSCCSIPATR